MSYIVILINFQTIYSINYGQNGDNRGKYAKELIKDDDV